MLSFSSSHAGNDSLVETQVVSDVVPSYEAFGHLEPLVQIVFVFSKKENEFKTWIKVKV